MGNSVASNYKGCQLTNIQRERNGDLTVTNTSGNKYPLSKRYGWSTHNCSCRGGKTGLVLYPFVTKQKNIVLLVCESCYGYRSNKGTQHRQLLEWYYGIYGDSKQYRCVSGFSQKGNGELGFNSMTLNAAGRYTDNTREMGELEQDIVRIVVNGQLESYIA
ncbi:unnamed protein product [Didymodactylos carnosus]|uniref:Uncharacterized protein n=1 Tax=Didymodactylos carnosus TaxID=1234261 RepID=A0A8S2G0A4_9BILA|nr:unnamed protein product [Didymodactylos carnosus]CAF4415256.1 unnamed protein product [Didymodactylos carnosus]